MLVRSVRRSLGSLLAVVFPHNWHGRARSKIPRLPSTLMVENPATRSMHRYLRGNQNELALENIHRILYRRSSIPNMESDRLPRILVGSRSAESTMKSVGEGHGPMCDCGKVFRSCNELQKHINRVYRRSRTVSERKPE